MCSIEVLEALAAIVRHAALFGAKLVITEDDAQLGAGALSARLGKRAEFPAGPASTLPGELIQGQPVGLGGFDELLVDIGA